jgi:peptidoglycan hydrolase CwlO-like protein
MKEMIKKFFWYALIPIGLFILSVIFKKDTSNLNDLIKKKKEEIKNTDKKIKDQEEQVKDSKKELDIVVDDIEKVKEKNLDNKKERDEEAKDFFPNL